LTLTLPLNLILPLTLILTVSPPVCRNVHEADVFICIVGYIPTQYPSHSGSRFLHSCWTGNHWCASNSATNPVFHPRNYLA